VIKENIPTAVSLVLLCAAMIGLTASADLGDRYAYFPRNGDYVFAFAQAERDSGKTERYVVYPDKTMKYAYGKKKSINKETIYTEEFALSDQDYDAVIACADKTDFDIIIQWFAEPPIRSYVFYKGRFAEYVVHEPQDGIIQILSKYRASMLEREY